MKGHEDLIKIRMQGITPACVTLYDFDMDTDWMRFNELPRVCIKDDYLVDLDLRFVIGMVVHIETYSLDRMERLFDKCIDMGARIIGASFTDMTAKTYHKPSKSKVFFRDYKNEHGKHHIARLD